MCRKEEGKVVVRSSCSHTPYPDSNLDEIRHLHLREVSPGHQSDEDALRRIWTDGRAEEVEGRATASSPAGCDRERGSADHHHSSRILRMDTRQSGARLDGTVRRLLGSITVTPGNSDTSGPDKRMWTGSSFALALDSGGPHGLCPLRHALVLQGFPSSIFPLIGAPSNRPPRTVLSEPQQTADSSSELADKRIAAPIHAAIRHTSTSTHQQAHINEHV
ncbi:hypothetical protein BJ546DRAFT_950626 [Cryomyces antarcticus]